MTDTVLRTVVRRETHSPRTAAMLVVVVLLLLALAYAAVEIILNLVGAQPLLVSPGEALNAVVAAPTALMPVAFIVGGVVLAVLGLLVLILALKPAASRVTRCSGASVPSSSTTASWHPPSPST